MIFNDSKLGIPQLVRTLNESEPVVIPTETVYGLAAKIDDSEAIKKIFLYKKRPFFDPLIVHIYDVSQLVQLTDYSSPLVDRLVQKFWPGPLTLILPKLKSVNEMITSGLDSVGVRLPRHPLALELLKQVGVPLAAPSANLFGQTSPTSAQDVEIDFPGLKTLDGGKCDIGIESTVLKIQPIPNNRVSLAILRKGVVTVSKINECLSGLEGSFDWTTNTDKKQSPGHMKHHYMPKVPIVYFNGPADTDFYLSRIQNDFIISPDVVEEIRIVKPVGPITGYEELIFSSDATIACRELYSKLKEKSLSAPLLIFKKQPHMSGEVWDAFLERISKASSLRYEV